MKTVLVTGGAGYIGSHVCKALAETGFAPVTYDNLSRGHRYLVKWGPLEIGDLADTDRLDEVLATHRPCTIVHLAAYAYVSESVDNPDLYYRNNVVNSRTLLEAMRKAKIRNIVFSSSCASYGIVEKLPITEETPQNPINPYGETKKNIEKFIAEDGLAHGLKWITFRYFNAAGADPGGECGEDHDPEPHIIPRAMMAAAGELSHFDILGTDYATEDGTAVRDYIHVTDLADAHVLGIKRLLNGGESAIFNIGSDRGFSVREIISSVERVSGRKIPLRKKPRRIGDPPTLIADSALIRKKLNFSPRHTNIDDIIETAWRWYRNGRNTKK